MFSLQLAPHPSFFLPARRSRPHGSRQDKDKEKPPVRVILVTGSGHDYPKFTIAMTSCSIRSAA